MDNVTQQPKQGKDKQAVSRRRHLVTVLWSLTCRYALRQSANVPRSLPCSRLRRYYILKGATYEIQHYRSMPEPRHQTESDP